jgi:hypothetical protein
VTKKQVKWPCFCCECQETGQRWNKPSWPTQLAVLGCVQMPRLTLRIQCETGDHSLTEWSTQSPKALKEGTRMTGTCRKGI